MPGRWVGSSRNQSSKDADGYIDDYMAAVLGRRRAFAVSAIFRGILRQCGFPLKAAEKECLPARQMTALGGDIDLDMSQARLSVERAGRYRAECAAVFRLSRYPLGLFWSLLGRLVSTAIYEPAGRPWLLGCFSALTQALRRRREHAFLGPGVKKELQFWIATIDSSVGVPLFPATDFPPPGTESHRADWFDAATSWGMGGAALVRIGQHIVAYFFTYEWQGAQKEWHVNVMESVAGETILEAADAVAPAPFQTGRGDNTTANAGHRRNATSNLQIAAVLKRRSVFVCARQISTRPVYVNTKKNVLGDPLSRGPKYFQDFKREASAMGASKFVRIAIPSAIFDLLDELGDIFPSQRQQELDNRQFRLARQPPSAPVTPPGPSRLRDLGIERHAWQYFVTFCGLDTFMQAARHHGGSPRLACDNHGPAKSFWQLRTGEQCLASLAAFRAAVLKAGPQLRRGVLLYTSGPPCTDFARSGCRRGTGGSTGHLFLEDAEAALDCDLPVIVSEIVVGILDEPLIQFLHHKVAVLRSVYRVEWRVFRCNRQGDVYTNRRRILIVGVKPEFLLEGMLCRSYQRSGRWLGQSDW